jgi:hypothetical protein
MPDLSSHEIGLKAGQLDLAHGAADDQWIARMQ